MLPEVQIVKHDLAAGCRRHETSAYASATSETLALCRIGKQYAVNREFRCMAGNAGRAQPNMAIRQTVLYTEPNGSV